MLGKTETDSFFSSFSFSSYLSFGSAGLFFLSSDAILMNESLLFLGDLQGDVEDFNLLGSKFMGDFKSTSIYLPDFIGDLQSISTPIDLLDAIDLLDSIGDRSPKPKPKPKPPGDLGDATGDLQTGSSSS